MQYRFLLYSSFEAFYSKDETIFFSVGEQFLAKVGVEYCVIIKSIFVLKSGGGVLYDNNLNKNLTFVSYFPFCQIFRRDSFRDINIIDTSIHPSRDTQFMKGQNNFKEEAEHDGDSRAGVRINFRT